MGKQADGDDTMRAIPVTLPTQASTAVVAAEALACAIAAAKAVVAAA
jgi:hypothetical protein